MLVPRLLAQVPSPGDGAAELVSYRFGRLDGFDDPRLLWAGVAVVAALLALFVFWQYRRERSALSGPMSVVLAALRLTAFAGAILFFLEPMKRADQQLVTQSRVAVLVDASQSMAVEDEQLGDDAGLSRSEAVLRLLRDEPFIARLLAEHDVTLAVFGADLRQVATWKRRTTSDQPGGSASTPLPPGERPGEGRTADAPSIPPPTPPFEGGGPESDGAPAAAAELANELNPLDAETRLGDALAAVLAEQSGGPLAAVYVLSDGGQNLGAEPLAVADAAAGRRTPIITVGLGSTDPRRNVRLQELIAPARAFPKDKIVVRALVESEGYAGRDVPIELYSRDGAADASAAVLVGQQTVSLPAAGETATVEFTIEPAEVGSLLLEARLAPGADDQYENDDRRTAEIEVVDSNTKVLLIAGGATRDYRFLRDQLRRDEHATVDVLLQAAPPGISQDADRILAAFPSTKEELFEYDAIVAFDPDWTQLDAAEVELIQQWVAEEAGGMIVVAGPVHTAAWLQSPEHAPLRALYPVEFQRRLTLLDDGLFGSKVPWPIDLTREGQEADFLWLGDTLAESRAHWNDFAGVFGCYAVKGPKPGAQVYGRYSDPEAGIAVERPVFFADHFYGAGRVFYMGSGELWRLRILDPGLFERLYTQLVRHVSQGRLMRGSRTGRLLVERDRYFVGDTVVVRAQLTTAGREPYVAPRVTARVTGPDDSGRNVDLLADPSRPGAFTGQFTASQEGSYRIELPAPEAADEQLVRRITAAVPDLEFDETRRNESLLTALAARTGGRYYASTRLALAGEGDVPPAAALVTSRAETKTLRGKPDERFAETVNYALLGVICGALCLEWLLRRLSKLA